MIGKVRNAFVVALVLGAAFGTGYFVQLGNKEQTHRGISIHQDEKGGEVELPQQVAKDGLRSVVDGECVVRLVQASGEPIVGGWVVVVDTGELVHGDANGEVCIRSADPGVESVEVLAKASGYMTKPIVVSMKSPGVTVTLNEQCIFSGRVLDGNSGEGIPFAEVRPIHDLENKTLADESGMFYGLGLPCGEETVLRVSAAGYIEEDFAVNTLDESMELGLKRGRLVRGVVVSTGGDALGGVAVEQIGLPVQVTDDRGGFALSVPEDEHGLLQVTFIHPGYSRLTLLLDPDVDGQLRPDLWGGGSITVTLIGSAQVSGTVHWTGGEPLEDGVVRVMAENVVPDARRLEAMHRQPSKCRSEPDRGLCFPVVNGKWRVTQADAWLTGLVLEFECKQSGLKSRSKISGALEVGDNSPLKLHMQQAGPSEGKVAGEAVIAGKVDVNGKPANGGSVEWVCLTDGSSGGVAVMEGRYEVQVPSGQILLRAKFVNDRRIDFSDHPLVERQAAKQIDIKPGQEAQGDFELHLEMGEITGTVLDDATSVPLEGRTVYLMDGKYFDRVVTSESGRFTFIAPYGMTFTVGVKDHGVVDRTEGVVVGDVLNVRVGVKRELEVRTTLDGHVGLEVPARVYWKAGSGGAWSVLGNGGAWNGVNVGFVSGIKVDLYVLPKDPALCARTVSVTELDGGGFGTVDVAVRKGVVVEFTSTEAALLGESVFCIQSDHWEKAKVEAGENPPMLAPYWKVNFPGDGLRRYRADFSYDGRARLYGLERGSYVLVHHAYPLVDILAEVDTSARGSQSVPLTTKAFK